MPNHWESSARSLFVRTVFVNGHRHAILFEEDPLLHYGNSTFKKISRSNSSLSFVSDHSFTRSESQDSNTEDRVSKLRNGDQRRRKDLSSELQSCLIKLRLSSANLENGIKCDEENCFCNSKEPESQKEISKQKKHKWKRDKNCRRKHCEHFQGESKESELTGKSLNKSSGCYFYNYERNQRKKNYCVVKISSQPSKFTLSCRCDNDLSETTNCKGFPRDKNKMLISATIHNLFMTARKEQLLDKKVDNSFLCENIDSIDLYWSSYLTRSYYNSLSERVFQWLDLASRRKGEKQKYNATQEDDSLNTSERIFSGKTFLGESKRTEHSDENVNKQRNKPMSKTRGNDQRETFKEKAEEGGVFREANIKSVSCSERSQNDTRELFEEETATATATTAMSKSSMESATVLVPEETKPNSPSEFILKSCPIPTKAPLKIQDLLLDYNSRGNFDISFGDRNARKIKGTREPSTFRSKRRQIKDLYSTEEEEEKEEEENVIVTPLYSWRRKTVQKTPHFDASGKQIPCHCTRNSDGFSDKINKELLTEGFHERNQKSINNLNITRTQPVLIQNLLSPQQHDEITSLRTDKAVWGSEKDRKRPQLHIFMPSLLLKDTSDDSLSECENVLNLC